MLYRDGNRISYIILFLFPILYLFEAIKNFRNPSARNLFWYFCVFYGLVHIYMLDGFQTGEGADSVRYAIALERMHDSDLTWEALKSSFYGGTDGGTDIYQAITTFLVSRFTGNAHILFCVFAVVFGFFYSRNIWYILSKCPRKLGFQLGVFIVSFALLTPIWLINGVRMWTALQVFMYGFLPYLLDKDRTKIWWSYGAFLFHFSFLALIALLLIYQFAPHKRLPFFILFILTFFVGELDLVIVREKLLGLGLTAFESKINTYTDDHVLESMRKWAEGYSWHVILAKNVSKYIYQGFIVVSYLALRRVEISKQHILNNLFCAAALFYSFSNIVASMPSGGRFALPAQMLSIITAIMIFPLLANDNIRSLYTLAAWGLIYPIIFSIRAGMDFWGISLLITNPVTCWFFEDNTPIIEFIKSVL